MTHDYNRNGTTTLFAALDVKTGEVIGECLPRHRAKEFIRFLKKINRAVAKHLDVHAICDNYKTHKTKEVQAWLAKHPRFKRTSHQHRRPGSTWSSGCSPKSPASKSAAAYSRASPNSRRHRDLATERNAKPKHFKWTAKANIVLEKNARERREGRRGGKERTSELGFDACIDHRAPEFAKQLEAACPKGIDVYFENVGGTVQQTVWPLLNDFARIPVCGLIAQYNATTPMPGPDMFSVLRKRLLLRGFIVSDFAAKQADFLRDVGEWVRTGRLKYREDIVDGLENAPASFLGMLQGKNFGKMLVKMAT